MTFGRSVVFARMNSKSGTLIGPDHRTRLFIAAVGCAPRCPGTSAISGSEHIDIDVAKAAVEVAVIRTAAEFAVCRQLEPEAILEGESLFDGQLLRFAQFRRA